MEVRYPTRKSAEAALHDLLQTYVLPAFGSVSKPDLDLAMLVALQDAGIVAPDPSEFELMMMLRITPTRARNLLSRLASPPPASDDSK